MFQGDHLYDEGDDCKIRIIVTDDDSVDTHLVELDRQGEGKRVGVTDPVHRSDPWGISKVKSPWCITGKSSTRSTSIARLNGWSYSSKAIWTTMAKPTT